MGASSRRPKNRHIAYKVSKYVPEKRLLDAKSIRKMEAKVPPWGFQCFVESLDAQQRAYLDKSGVRDCIQEVMKAVLEEKREASDAVQFLIECFDQIRIQPRLQELRPVQPLAPPWATFLHWVFRTTAIVSAQVMRNSMISTMPWNQRMPKTKHDMVLMYTDGGLLGYACVEDT